MRDVIQKVLEAEDEAKRMLEQARQEAAQIEAQARKEAQAIQARMERESRAEAGRILEEATRAAEREKQERLTDATREINDQVRLSKALKQRAVQEVIRCVRSWHEPAANSGDAGPGFHDVRGSRPAGPEQASS
jgi:vacuolar-type H+-ATPase subunit H